MQHLQPGAQPQDNAGAHCVAGLSKQAVRPTGGMVQGQPLEQGGELGRAVAQEHLIHCRQVLLLRAAGGVQIHIEDECL